MHILCQVIRNILVLFYRIYCFSFSMIGFFSRKSGRLDRRHNKRAYQDKLGMPFYVSIKYEHLEILSIPRCHRRDFYRSGNRLPPQWACKAGCCLVLVCFIGAAKKSLRCGALFLFFRRRVCGQGEIAPGDHVT